MRGFLATVAVFFAVFAANVYANTGVVIEGVPVNFTDQAPVIVEERTLVPVRGVFEQLGFSVTWNDPTATLTRSDFTVMITVGSASFTTNGETFRLDVPAQIIGNRTMLPIRAVLESVGYRVGWDGTNVLVSAEPVAAQSTPATTPVAAPVVVPPAPAPPIGERPAYITIGDRTFSADTTSINIVGLSWTCEDIVPLRYLTDLTTLGLGETPIVDLTPIAGLTNLSHLSLRNTRVSDITPLAGLTNLTDLHLGNTQVSDLTPLAGLTNLETFRASNANISDITPLAGLTNLETLYLTNNRVSDLTPLAGLANLRRVRLVNNPISDITPLSGLSNLQIVDLFGTQVTDWSPVDHVRSVGGPPIEGLPTRNIIHGIEFEQQFAYHLPDLVPPFINDARVQVMNFLEGIYRVTVSLDDVTFDPRAPYPFFFWQSAEGTFHDVIDDREEYAQFTFKANPGTGGRNVRLIIGFGDGLGQVNRAAIMLKGNDS